jgi:hypothetical protein
LLGRAALLPRNTGVGGVIEIGARAGAATGRE